MNLPLSDVVMVEANSPGCSLALRLTMSLAGRIAADLGAKVIKVEPPEGDPLRRLAPLVGGIGATFVFLNAGKKSVTLAARDVPGALKRMNGRTDVAILDGAMVDEIGASELPRVAAILSMTGQGHAAATSEFTLMALGGLLDIVGDPEREPLRLGGHQLSYTAGLSAYAGIAAALAQTENGGRETVRVSLLDAAIWLNWKSVAVASWTGRAPKRAGRAAEWQVVRCADGWVALVFQDSDWPVLQALVDDPRLTEERFQTRASRRANARDLADIVEQALGRMTRRALHEFSLSRRIPLGPIWSPAELRDDPQTLAREFLTRLPLGTAATALVPRLPVVWNGTSFRPGNVPMTSDALRLELQ